MKEPAKSFKDLVVWQKAHELVMAIYKVSAQFPKDELYGLTSQIRRSASSIAANIAEAFKKRSEKDKLRILNIAQGSLSETQYHLLLASDLKYGNVGSLENKAEEVSRLLESYMKAIRD
jgi:four helix bundle protein